MAKDRDSLARQRAKQMDNRVISAARLEFLNAKIDINRLRMTVDGGYLTIMGKIALTDKKEEATPEEISLVLDALNKSLRKISGVKYLKFLLDSWELKDGQKWVFKGGGPPVKDSLLALLEEVKEEEGYSGEARDFSAKMGQSPSQTDLAKSGGDPAGRADLAKSGGDPAKSGGDPAGRADLAKSGGDPAGGPAFVATSGQLEIKKQEKAPKITEFLEGESRETKVQAAIILAGSVENDEIAKIQKALKTEKDKFVIATLVKTLARRDGKKAIEHIAPFLEDEDDRVRANTIEAFEIIGDESIVPLILPMLDDKNHRVKGNAIKALTSLGREKFLGQLKAMLKSDQWKKRAAGIFALKALKPSVAMPMVYPFLEDKDERVVLKAIETTAYLGGREYLLEKIEKSPPAPIMAALARALGKRASAHELPVLEKMLFDYPPEIALIFLEAIGSNPEGIPIVRDSLNHPESLIKEGALSILTSISDPFLVDEYLAQLSENDPVATQKAVLFLSRLKPELILPKLIPLLIPQDLEKVRNAIKILSLISAPGGRATMVETAMVLEKIAMELKKAIKEKDENQLD